MNLTELIHVIETQPIFEGLNDEEINELAQICSVRDVANGEDIILEGSSTNSIYLILNGEVEVLKLAQDLTSLFHINSLSKGSYFGEMSFIDHSKRSSTVRATKPSQILEISKDAIMVLPHAANIFNMIKFNIANRNSLFDRLRNANSTIVTTLQKEKELLEKQNRFGHFFIVTTLQTTIVVLINHLIAAKIGMNNQAVIYGYLFLWSYLIVVALPCFVYLICTHQQVSLYGVNLLNWKKTLTETTIAIFIVAILFACINEMRWVKIPDYFTFYFFTYFLHSAIQEFIARGIVLTSIHQFYGHKKTFLAVMISSLLFGVIHIHFGMMAVFITFLSGIVFGYIFLHQRNIFGVTVLHAVLGYFAFNINLI